MYSMSARIIFIVFLGFIFILSHCNNIPSKHPEPVNPNTIQEARNLLDFIYEIEGKHILSGHHNYNGSLMRFHNAVKEITGKYPVVWGADFSFNFPNNNPDSVRQAIVDKAIELYSDGHIITLMWHSPPPEKGTSSSASDIWIWEPGVSEEYWDSLITTGTKLNKQWQKQVDDIAGYLKQLEKAEVPVLWRPYHEMNGIWFWWCNERGKDGYQKLWKMMYDRLVNHHQLNNLLWVWNPNAPRDKEGDEAYAYQLFFPGLDYVDILAADVYHNDYRLSHHDDLLKLADGKPIALGEVGQLPTPKIINNQSQWTWFMGWASWIHKANDPDSVRALYNAPKVITKDEISKGSDGNFSIKLNR